MPRPDEQESANGGADHPACIVGADIQRHRGAHPLAAHDLTHHHTAHRVVGAPAAPVDETGEREMPDLELSGPVQNCEDRRGDGHDKHDDEESSAAIKAFRKRAEKHPEETHRKQTEHGHHRDQKRRIGALVDDDPDRDGFQPAHGGDDQADIPQAPEVRCPDHPPERRVAHAIASMQSGHQVSCACRTSFISTRPRCAWDRHLRVETAGGGRCPATSLFAQRLHIVAAIAVSFQT